MTGDGLGRPEQDSHDSRGEHADRRRSPAESAMVADLSATVRELAAANAAQRRLVEELSLHGQPTQPAGLPAYGFEAFAHGDPGPGYEDALATLDAWVRQVLVPAYVTGSDPSPATLWCPQWWRHPQARARLYGLWLAWLELTDPVTGGMTGPSVWHRDHLDPTLDRLRSPLGPFAACTSDADRPRHTEPDTPVPVASAGQDASEPRLDPGGRSMSARAMDRAMTAGRARPLSERNPDFAQYREAWWFRDAASWIRVDEPQAAAQLDALAADITRVEHASRAPVGPGGGAPPGLSGAELAEQLYDEPESTQVRHG